MVCSTMVLGTTGGLINQTYKVINYMQPCIYSNGNYKVVIIMACGKKGGKKR